MKVSPAWNRNPRGRLSSATPVARRALLAPVPFRLSSPSSVSILSDARLEIAHRRILRLPLVLALSKPPLAARLGLMLFRPQVDQPSSQRLDFAVARHLSRKPRSSPRRRASNRRRIPCRTATSSDREFCRGRKKVLEIGGKQPARIICLDFIVFERQQRSGRLE